MEQDFRADFVKKYRPIAQQVGKELGVDPNVILSQWALESRWGTAVPAENNIAGIKDFTGAGTPAKDNKLGTTAKYARFESPEVFGVYYSDMMQRQFPKAMNAGSDIDAFTKGLTSGRSGSYFEADPGNYASGLTAFNKQIAGSVQGDTSDEVVRPPPAETDEELVGAMNDLRREAEMQSDEEAQEKRQAQIYGGVAGAGVSAGKLAGTGVGAALEGAGRRLAEGMASVTGNRAPTAPTTTGPLTSGEKWAAATGYGRGAGTVQDVSSSYQRGVGKGKVTGRMDKLWGVPQRGESPQLSQRLIDRANAANAARAAATAAPSGLDTVSRMFTGMMRPVAAVANTGLKYLAPPLALASAAGEGVNIAQQLRREPEPSPLDVLGQSPLTPQRDTIGMGLSAANILGSGMSLFPGTAAVGIPLALGTAAAQEYRSNPEARSFIDEKLQQAKKRLREAGQAPYSDPMTGFSP